VFFIFACVISGLKLKARLKLRRHCWWIRGWLRGRWWTAVQIMERLSPAANAMGVNVSVDLSVCECGGSTPQAAHQSMWTDGE